MVIVVGTKHSGSEFLLPTLQQSGLRRVAWKPVEQGKWHPADSVVRAPMSALKWVGTREDRVVGLVRDWRTYAATERAAGPSRLPPEVTWWFQNMRMINGLARRGSPFLLVGFDRLVSSPAAANRRILRFLNRPAIAEVPQAFRPERQAYSSAVLRRVEMLAFDRLVEAVEGEQLLTRSDLMRFAAVTDALRERFPRVRGVGTLRVSSARVQRLAAAK
jgi:hypothetical protein